MSYGKHQSFYLRSNWINKSFQAGDKFGLEIFLDTNRFMDLGIGKNMFQALRYWLEATNIIQVNARNIEYTYFGQLLHDFDRGINKNLSLNLLHYFLCNLEDENHTPYSHVFYWLYNVFNDTISNKDTLVHDLIIWNNEMDKKRISEKTIRKDVDCLINTYTKNERSHPEDKNISILSSLHLIEKLNDNFVKVPIQQHLIDYDAFLYILLVMKERNEILNIETITNAKGSIGKAFHLNRVEIIEHLEKLATLYPISITRTNNLDTVDIQMNITSIQFMENVYTKEGK